MDNLSWLQPKEPVWVLKNANFIKAVIETLNSDSAICMLEDGSLIHAKKHLIYQRNPAYKEFNAERWDLMDTDVLNQPEILKTLKFRLANERIYTFIENSLLSVNPYKRISMLYSDPLKDFYGNNIILNQQNPRDFQPHLYSVAANMLNQLQTKMHDQAVVISGQSGAGKTQANKQCLRFLQHYFHTQKSDSINQNIDDILLLSNPILQAFGNAKTIRNNNSSRFGKFMSIFVNKKLQVKHIKVYNYLLQKSRLINRAENEQNFHIFYQFLRGLSKTQKHKYFLQINGRQFQVEDFNYLKTTKLMKYERQADVSFEKVKLSLNTLPAKNAYEFVCRVLSAILLLGNLVPYQNEKEDRCYISTEQVLQNICQLLKIEKKVLTSALTCYMIKINGQTLTKHFNYKDVQELINSLAKLLYQRLFQWIINEINLISSYQGPEKLFNLGFLDIYGFQILQTNSLEQLFINYTNERLHQIYLTKIFKEEGQLFEKEGLSQYFKSIPYSDNIKVLQLIDYEQLSLFNLLDDHCEAASPDDTSFVTKLRHRHKKHPNFPPHNFNLPSTLFSIRHSPKDIQYTVIGFKDKNKDMVRDEIKKAMQTSGLKELSELFDENPQGKEIKGNHKMKKFLSYKFKHEINTLMVDLLGKCNLHFIRCIKSNSLKQPMLMQDQVVFNQICYLGVLDTIKLKKVGYCIKLDYGTLDKRFKWLVRHYYTQQAFDKEIKNAIANFLPRYTDQEIIYGKTIVFFRDYAYSTFVKNYQQYVENLKYHAFKITSVLLKFRYLNKLKKKKKIIKNIREYLRSKLIQASYAKTIKSIVKIQRLIREKIVLMKKQRLMKNYMIVQAYIKKQIYRRIRVKYLTSVKKIISAYKRYKTLKEVQKYAIINKIKTLIIQKSYIKYTLKKKNIIETYIKSFMVQISRNSQIVQANINTYNKFKTRNIKIFNNYMKTICEYSKIKRQLKKIIHVQKVIKTFIYRSKYVKLKQSAIIIQRAFREYYFNKNTARQIFNINFGSYQAQIQQQNAEITKILYQNSINDSLRILYKNYINKYRAKCPIFYFIIDFQNFINLELTYPENSWLLNYFHIVKESLQKDNPIQNLHIASTYTVASTTNKLYVWGMNNQFNTLHKAVVIKPLHQNRIEKIKITNNELKIIYQGQNKENHKALHQTITCEYELQNGKLIQSRHNMIKIIKMPNNNERIVQLACGSSHVIMKTSLKRLYSFGNGKHGQLGHGNYFSVQTPKLIEFQELKSYYPLQISSSFNSSIILLSNKKIFWFGSNGTISKIKSPICFQYQKKFQEFSNEYAPLKINASWSRSLSTIGITFIHFNGKLSNNIPLRNKVHELILSKWQEQDIQKINPPYHSSYSDYLQECHVKLPRTKISVQPQSKKILRKLQQKVQSLQSQKYNDISFADHNFK